MNYRNKEITIEMLEACDNLDLTGTLVPPLLLFDFLMAHPEVHTLNYSCNSLEKMEKLASLPHLVSLDLSANAIVDPYKINMAYLVRVLSPSILELTLRNHNHTCMKAISQATTLVRLDISDNNIRDRGARDLATSLLHGMQKLQHLNLSSNSIGPDGIVPICVAVQQIGRLKSLNLFRNPITDKGVLDGITRILGTVNNLNLRNTLIGPVGARAIADSIVEDIELLDLGANNLGAVGVESILDSLKWVKIKHLLLDNNNVRRALSINR